MLSCAQRTTATAHVYALAEEHAIEVRRAKSWATAEVYVNTRQAWLPEIRLGSDYLVCLHEIGHIVDGDSRGYGQLVARAPRGRPSGHAEIMHEAAAWSWAAQNALLPLMHAMTKADWARVGDCWSTYLAC